MTYSEAERAIRAELAGADTDATLFWKGVLVGLGCRYNLNFNLEVMKDLARRLGKRNEPVAYP